MNAAEKAQERQRLSNLITQWNQDHYDLFELSQPNEECEFHGVVRFYFQDGANVVTKCIRVASSATAGEVIEVLVEKFRPDMRMLTTNKYALFEVHANGEDRRIMFDEKILYVQLTWGKDVREGRFLMRREGAEVIAPEEKQQFKRNLSKREKKEKKKQEKQNRGKENKGAAEKLYTDMPESKFTRSISNPDAVMRRRRQQKVEKKLQQCRDKHGQGGTLKIYGDTLKPDIPYKTLLLSTSDTVAGIVKEAMEKYGLENEDTEDFCLVQVIVPPEEQEYHGGSMGEERIMDDSECPLFIAMEFPPARGTVLFQLKRRSPDQLSTKHKKLRAVSHDDLRSHQRDEPDTMPQNKLPYLIELHPDGSDNPNGRIHQIHRKFTDVGSDKSTAVIFVKGTNIQPRHCVLGLSPNDGIVLVTPTNTDSETYVNNQRVYETTKLQNGNTLRLGKLNYFRFIDPIYEERLKKGQVLPSGPIQKHGGPYNPKPQETNFDVDGKVETMADNSPRSNDQPMHGELQKRSQSVQNMGPPREPERPPPQRRIDEALPAALEYREEKEDGFLTSVILDNNSGTQFKLAPTYTIYMALRYTLSNNYRPDLSPSDRANKVTILVSKVSKMILQAIQSNCDNPATLAFWMANASEVLHFFKQDHDIHPFSMDAQETLAESVQMAFHHLVRCLQYDLQRTMPAFLDESEAADDDMMQDDSRYNRGKPTLGDVLDTLSSAMNLLRRCRVNAALTIQLFSQLFHFINMWLFNIMVTGHHSEFCTRSWGVRLKRRLGRIEAWAEKQGLELAADCHLCRIIQAAHLLQAPKASSDDIADISSTCFKLNSLQLQELLQRYMPEPGEPPIPHSLIESVVSIAQNMADDLTKNDGREVQLEEDSDLQLPFLLPEDGYSCDTVRNIPNGLADFIEPFARAGLCRMVAQPASRGEWTVYMTSDEHMVDDAVQRGPSTPQPPPNAEPRQLRPQLPKEPEVMTVTFNKVNGSMGLSIVAAKGEGQKERGIYIKSVVQGGAAALDKRLQAGDQLLEVDGKSLIGLTQEKAAELMTRTGQTVSLKVAKQGAFFHGLANLLSQPSPVMQRAASPKKSSRPQEEGPPPYNGSGDMDRGRHGPGHRDQRQVMNTSHSRSSPSLNSDGMGSDRMKATSTGNLRDPQMSQVQPPNHHERIMHPRDMRDPGLMSKSIPNLRMDNSFDSREHQQGPPQQMRPAASVGALQHDYYNHSMDRRGDPRAHDYENQQNLDPRLRNAPEPGRMDRGYPEAAQSLPPNIGLAGGRGPPSSRNSQSSFRDERPRSEYFGHPAERPDLREERPRSMEINANKIHEWQQKYNMDDHHSQPSPHERSFEGRDPNYVNTSRSPPHSSPGYVNSGDIPKMSANNEARQPNFYENTVPRQTEPQPAFHQMRKPQMDHPPQTAPKPMVATKPASRVMPVDIPRVEADNRHSQPHFFDPRTQQGQASPKPMNQSSYMAGQPHMVHSPGFNDPRNASLQRNQKFPQGREMYNHHQSPELPPAPLDIPPELPPPPAGMDMDDDLPPLPPPPPAQDYRPDPRDDMDPPYANQGDPRFSMPPSSYSSYNAPHQQSNYSQHHFQDPRQDHSMMAYSEPQRHPPPQQLPPAKPQHIHPQSYQPNHDYQNISYEGRSPNRSFESPPQHSPNQNVYEPYENKSASLPPGVAPQGYMPQAPMKNTTMPRNMAAPQQFTSQSKNRLVAEMSERTKDGKPLSSAWDRDEKERIEKEQQIDMKKARDAEISDLESRSYLSPQEQDRLRKLRLEQEFQRRVQEVEGREEEEEDSDHDISNNTQTGREYMINALKEDIVKAQKRLEDYNRKRMFEEMDKEKERKAVLEASLERKLEMFEREKEERQERLRQRQEKRQREQEEKLQKLKESREKQRQEYEEQKRLMIAEEEKNRARKMEEIQRRKDIEREQKRKAQEARDAEEKVLRAEARRREEEFQRQQQEQRDRERREANREITVTDERKRLEVLTVQTQQQQQYQPYANLPSQYSPPDRYTINVPPPPTRGSSYEAANRSNGGGPNSYEAATRSNPSMVNSYNGYKSHSPAGRGPPEPAFKKSVKFNTQLETQINTYNEDQGRGNSVSSYRSSVSDQHSPSSPSINSPALDNNSNAFVSTPQQNHVDQKYCTTENTPTVIGAQEVYRDPRNRINAQKDFIVAQPYKKGQEKMSFKDKMKFFAAEAGEETPKYKPKASKTLRNIESQLHNGQ